VILKLFFGKVELLPCVGKALYDIELYPILPTIFRYYTFNSKGIADFLISYFCSSFISDE